MSDGWMNVFHDQIQERENKAVEKALEEANVRISMQNAQDFGFNYNDAVDYVVKKFNVTPEYVNQVING